MSTEDQKRNEAGSAQGWTTGRIVPDRRAALVTLQWPTEWQEMSMAIYGPLTCAQVEALSPLVAAISGATFQVMPLDPMPGILRPPTEDESDTPEGRT